MKNHARRFQTELYEPAKAFLMGDTTEAYNIKRGTHIFIALLILLCAIAFVWSCLGKLDIASVAPGEVFPSTKLKHVQHLEGGIVKEIFVKDGQTVKINEPLVELESTSTGADYNQLQIQIASLEIDVVRLDAEMAGAKELVFPEELTKKYPKLVTEARRFFDARINRHASQKVSQSEQIEQKAAAIKEIETRIEHAQHAAELAQEQVDISNELLEEDLTNRYEHINLLRELNSLKSKIKEDTALLENTQSALDEEKSDLSGVTHQYKEEVSQKEEETRRKLDELVKQMEKYADNLLRTTIVAPVSGTVQEIMVSKKEVVKPGGTILDLIPTGDQLIVDARLPVYDKGFVHAGQKAKIRLASSLGMRFNSIDAEVTVVSADSTKPENGEGEPYYKVRLVTKQDYFKRGSEIYKLSPGVQVTVNIVTGKRSIISYMLDPFTHSFDTALMER